MTSNSGHEPLCLRNSTLGHLPPKFCTPALTATDPGKFRAFLPPRHPAWGCRGVAPARLLGPAPANRSSPHTPHTPRGGQSPAALQLHPHPHLGCNPRLGPAPHWGSPGSALLSRGAPTPSFLPARFLFSQTRRLNPQPPLPSDLAAPATLLLRRRQGQNPFPLMAKNKEAAFGSPPALSLIRT